MRVLVLTVGTPASGKSTWINQNGLKPYTIEPDDIRLKIQGPVLNLDGTKTISQKNDGIVWKLVFDLLEERMKLGELTIIDATHSSSKLINKYRQLVKKYRYRIVAVDFRDQFTLDEILENNRNRIPKWKFVPEEAIKRIHERLKTFDIPSWVQVIKPNEWDSFVNNYNSPKDFNHYQEINIFGDIHGAAKELISLWNKVKPSENSFNIFLGDYFDRFPTEEDLYQTFEFLKNLDPKRTLLLTGNHERGIYFYDEWFTYYEKKKKIEELENSIKEINEKITQEECNPNKDENYELTIKRLRRKLDKKLEKLRDFNRKAFNEEYDKNIRKKIQKGTRTVFHKLTDKYGMKSVKELFNKFAQIAYVDFRGKKLFCNHGGYITPPEITTSFNDLMYGIGEYGDELKVCEIWTNNITDDYYQFFGHRNIERLPIKPFENSRSYLLNGDAELGGPDAGLRAIKVLSSGEIKEYFEPTTREVSNLYKNFRKIIKTDEENESILKEKGILGLAKEHRGVMVNEVKSLTDKEKIYSINFKSFVFKDGSWDSFSIHARGLFVKKGPEENDEKIIARGFHKFFNLNERGETILNSIRDRMKFPVIAVEKHNGYLGLLSVYENPNGELEWFISTKSVIESKYVDIFKKLIDFYLINDLKYYIYIKDITLTFEVIDPENDPHIQEYNHPSLYFLDAIKNKLDFELDYESKLDIQEMFKQRNQVLLDSNACNEETLIMKFPKEIEIKDFQELKKFINEINNDEHFEKENYIEGYVIKEKGNSPFMFKLKTDWYKRWKYFRSIKDLFSKKIQINYINGKELKALIPEFKAKLHTLVEYQFFNFLLDEMNKCKNDLIQFRSIIDLRKKFFKWLKKPE